MTTFSIIFLPETVQMDNVTVIFRYETAKEIEDIARELSTTKSDIVRLCVHEGIKRIRAGEFKFTVRREEISEAAE